MQELDKKIELERLIQQRRLGLSRSECHQVALPQSHFVDMPKIEIAKFDGSPKAYRSFMKEFEAVIDSKPVDHVTRLTFLIQYCTGPAREAIQHCTILDSSEGLKEAKEILRKRFGQKYMIARAYIDDFIDGLPISSDNVSDLVELFTKSMQGQ